MQWLIDLVIEAIGIPPTFIDRGDPPAADFIIGDFTKDGGWHDLDLSAIVPAKATSVLFTLRLVNAAINKNALFREKGNANDKNISQLVTQTGGLDCTGDFTCPLDADRKLQYKIDVLGWFTITFTAKGWWL